MPRTRPLPESMRDQAQQGPDHRRLARAVGAQQADRPLRQRDRQAPQRRDLAVGLGHILQLDQHRRSRSRPYRSLRGFRPEASRLDFPGTVPTSFAGRLGILFDGATSRCKHATIEGVCSQCILVRSVIRVAARSTVRIRGHSRRSSRRRRSACGRSCSCSPGRPGTARRRRSRGSRRAGPGGCGRASA